MEEIRHQEHEANWVVSDQGGKFSLAKLPQQAWPRWPEEPKAGDATLSWE